MDRGKTRITVAGTGAFGLTIAWSLARAGFRVSIFDPAQTNASSVAAGMLAPVFETILEADVDGHLPLLMAARDLWPALAGQLGIYLDRRGATAVGDPEFLARVSLGISQLGMWCESLARSDLDAAVPGLSPSFQEGLLTQEDWRLEPVSAMSSLRKAAKAAGVDFHRGPATGLEGGDKLVIATGAGRDLISIAPQLKVLSPIKGQILRSMGQGFEGVLRLPAGYCVGGSGALAVGATMEPGLSDLTPTSEARSRLEALARQAFPGGAADFQAQVGVRAATPDGLPMIGRTEDPHVFLAVGARRNGWLLAPLAAQIITACLTEGEVGPYGPLLDPMRFI